MSGNNALAAAKRRRVGAQTIAKSVSFNENQKISEPPARVNPLDLLTSHEHRIDQIERVLDNFHEDGGLMAKVDFLEQQLGATLQELDKLMNAQTNVALEVKENPTFPEGEKQEEH